MQTRTSFLSESHLSGPAGIWSACSSPKSCCRWECFSGWRLWKLFSSSPARSRPSHWQATRLQVGKACLVNALLVGQVFKWSSCTVAYFINTYRLGGCSRRPYERSDDSSTILATHSDKMIDRRDARKARRYQLEGHGFKSRSRQKNYFSNKSQYSSMPKYY